MKAKVLETAVTFEFKGEDAESLVLGLSSELSEKEHFDAYFFENTITVSSDLFSEEGIAAEVYLLCGGKIDFLFNVNPGNHVVNVARSSVRFGFFGYRDNDFADEVKSLMGNVLFINTTTDGNELTVWSKNHSCSELRVLVENDSHEVSDKIEWIK
ncbi:MAG: hypothetical protein HXK00_00165 [Abiotrophia defectiva]|uniref:Uncharacterized protein n=1 Tax=Abiotrophia defectiva TaxID=46125 RepID=A0A929QS16_ABIDE|nr:hypothetical protein [Abiotrophia defectiva]